MSKMKISRVQLLLTNLSLWLPGQHIFGRQIPVQDSSLMQAAGGIQHLAGEKWSFTTTSTKLLPTYPAPKDHPQYVENSTNPQLGQQLVSNRT